MFLSPIETLQGERLIKFSYSFLCALLPVDESLPHHASPCNFGDCDRCLFWDDISTRSFLHEHALSTFVSYIAIQTIQDSLVCELPIALCTWGTDNPEWGHYKSKHCMSLIIYSIWCSTISGSDNTQCRNWSCK